MRLRRSFVKALLFAAVPGSIVMGAACDNSTTPGGLTNFIAAGHELACGIAPGGRVYCQGSNDYGGLGNGGAAGSCSYVSEISTAVEIAVGDNFACARLSDKTVTCWGKDDAGQLGNGAREDDGAAGISATPITVSGVTGATQISTSDSTACVVVGTGQVECWGSNSYGEAGNGTTSATSTPVFATGIETAVQVSSAFGHTCALLQNGTVNCWGYNVHGEAGLFSSDAGVAAPGSAIPVAVSGVRNAAAIATNNGESCALLNTGLVECWGLDSALLGLDGLSNALSDEHVGSAPATIPGLSGVTEISGGYLHMCARTFAGIVTCWGYETALENFADEGDPEDKTNGVVNYPYAPFGADLPDGGSDQSPQNVSAIAAGIGLDCIVVGSSSAECRGRNDYGQLGDGTTNNSVPFVDVVSCTTACSDAGTSCNGTCTNTQTDNANCGACGTVCAAGMKCSDAKCAVTPVTDAAADSSADASTDSSTDASPDSGVDPCIAQCQKVAQVDAVDGGPGCPSETSASCLSGCTANEAMVPASCAGAYRALATCFTSAPASDFVCSCDNGQTELNPVSNSCLSQQQALAACQQDAGPM